MFSFIVDSSHILTGVCKVEEVEYECSECGDIKTKRIVTEQSDWQGEGLSLNIMGLNDHSVKPEICVEGDCHYVVVEFSDNTSFTNISHAKIYVRGTSNLKIKNRFMRVRIVGGKRTRVSVM